MAMVQWNIEQKNGAHVMAFRGALDALTVPDVRAEVEALVARAPKRLVIDLSGIETVDSSGVALVVSVFKRMRALGGSVRVSGLRGQPKEIFEFLKLDQSLPIAPSVDDALAAM